MSENPAQPGDRTETVVSHGGRVETTTTTNPDGSVAGVVQTASVVEEGEEIVGYTADVI